MPKENASLPPKRPKKTKRRKKAVCSARQLTTHLRELAAEIETMDNDGIFVTRGEVLASLIWKKALGYTEIVINADKEKVEVYHKPESWAIQLIWDRVEGKAPLAVPDEKGRQTAATKVDELARSRINSVSEAILAISGSDGPVDLPDHGTQGS